MQIQREAAAKQYANTRYDQPYQAALFEMKVLLEAQRWHTDEYEAVIGGLEPGDLAVRALITAATHSYPSCACSGHLCWAGAICRIPCSCLHGNACAVQRLIAVSLGKTIPVPAQAFVRRLTCRCKVTGFATGNLDGHGVKSLAADVEAMLKVHPRAPEILSCITENCGFHIQTRPPNVRQSSCLMP